MEGSAIEKVFIRLSKPEDIQQLLTIENRCFRSHRFTVKDFERHLINSSSIFAVVESSGQIVGYIAGLIYHGGGTRTAGLYSMAVLPKWRQRGIGSRLLKYFEREAIKRGARSAFLEVRKTNRAAQALYRRFGYEVEEVLRDYYAPRSNGLRMRKPLMPGKRFH